MAYGEYGVKAVTVLLNSLQQDVKARCINTSGTVMSDILSISWDNAGEHESSELASTYFLQFHRQERLMQFNY